MRLYAEEEVLAACDKAVRLFGHDVPAARKLLLDELRKEPAVLFEKAELLEEANTTTDRILIHGIFGVYGTQLVSEESLNVQAKVIGFPDTVKGIIASAKARREEQYEAGATYRDADGRLFRCTSGGFLQYVITGANCSPNKPLEKI